MAQFVNMFDVDLKGRHDAVRLKQMVVVGNNAANRIGAVVYDNGQPVTLNGQCTGLVLRDDGSTVPLTGTINGNQAYIVLDQTSCAINGEIKVAVNWVSGNKVTTLVVAYGAVLNIDSGTYIQPSTPIPDLTQLLAQIDAMEQATARANAAADKSVRYDTDQSLTNEQKKTARDNINAARIAIISGAFDPNRAEPYNPGDYCTYNGSLYRFTAEHTGEWTGTDAVAVTVGNEINHTTVKVNRAQSLNGTEKSQARANIDAAAIGTLAVAFDPNRAEPYNPGEYCTRNGSLYRFTAEHTGAWSDSDAIAVTVANEINNTTVKTNVSQSLTDDQKTRARNNIGAASADEVGEINSALIHQIEGFDSITTEKYVAATGVDQSGKAINITGKVIDAGEAWHVLTINVSPDEAYRVTAAAVYKGYWYIFTDGTNTVGLSEQCEVGGGTITDVLAIVPEGATQLILSWNATYITGAAKKIVGYSVDECAALEARIEPLEDLTETVESTVDVPFSDITINDNYYMDYAGNVVGPYATWRYGEYTIPGNATALEITGLAGQAARLWLLKDASGSIVGYSNYSGAPTVFSETIQLSDYPSAKKAIVNDRKSDSLAISYTYDARVIDGEDVYINGESLPSIIGGNQNVLYGKVLCCCGDSITYGADMDSEGIISESNIDVYQSDSNGNFTKTGTNFRKTWNYDIASRNNMTLYNAGITGSTMQAIAARAGFSLVNGRYTKLPDTIDYLLIWFGWNDAAYGTLGTIDDSTNESYYGGFNVVLPYLIDKYPYAKIGLIVPYGTTPGHREAVRLLGNKWGLAIWDNYQGGTPLYFGKEESVGVEASVVTANKAKFQALGAHPNHYGHAQLADMIEKWMRGI